MDVNVLMDNPFSLVKGKLPTVKEYAEWSSDKWLSFMAYCSKFLELKGRDSERIIVNNILLTGVENECMASSHQWNEFHWRMNFPVDDHTRSDNIPKSFLWKLNTFIIQGMQFLKKHPAHVTEEMKKVMLVHPRFAKAAVQYRVDEGIVVQDHEVPGATGTSSANLPSLQARVMENIVKTADIYAELADSLTPTQIKKMRPEARLSAMSKLFPVMISAIKNRVVPNHFTQININGNVGDKEKAMLGFLKARRE